MQNNIIFLIIVCFFISCSNKKNTIALWEITKKNTPTSYFLAYNPLLTKKEAKKQLTKEIIAYFDSCKTYIQYWDLENSDLVETKKWIEIGNNKTLKDTLSKQEYLTLQKALKDYKDSTSLKEIRIIPSLFIHDLLTKPTAENFNVTLFFNNRAMPLQKNIVGIETYQGFYKKIRKKTTFNLTYFLSQNPSLNKYRSKLIKEQEKLKTANINKVKEVKNAMDVFFGSPQKTQNFYRSQYPLWIEKITSHLQNEICFIVLDINFIVGNNSFLQTLTQIGYTVKRIK